MDFDKTWVLPDIEREEAMTTALKPEQVREEHAYVVGVQTALWGRPFLLTVGNRRNSEGA